MKYKIGDTVLHWSSGLCQIIGIEEKAIGGQTRQYYVVQTPQLTMWVPTDESGENSLRPPSSSTEFKKRVQILQSDGEQLHDDRYLRQSQLLERMRRRTLEDICYVIRDLNARSRKQKLNINDSNTLKRAEDLLLDEWQFALGISRERAEHELSDLLK
jgi:CarD family transcriptional regulator